MSAITNLKKALLEAGVIDADKLARAEGTAATRGQTLEKALVALGLCDETSVWRALAKAHGLKFVDPAKFAPQQEALKRVPKEQILANEALPVLLPQVNADGNDVWGPQERQRSEQDGPATVGQRPNADQLDLNRDYIKNEAPESRASLAKFRSAAKRWVKSAKRRWQSS